MAVKVNVGLAKKIGQPNFGSLGATCAVEFELDGGFVNGSAQHFQDAVRRAYAACRQAVETELGGTGDETDLVFGSSRIGVQHSSSAPQHGHGDGNGTGHAFIASRSGFKTATSNQVRAIHAIANRNRVDLPGLLSSQFNVDRPEDLSISDASSLIDQMKGTSGSPGSAVSR